MRDFKIFNKTVNEGWYGGGVKYENVLKLLESNCLYS